MRKWEVEKRCAGTVVAVAIFALLCAAQPEKVPVVKDGRKVQLDGFLLEWKAVEARPFDRRGVATCDAANTPEGLAGYVCIRQRDTCAPVLVSVVPNCSAPHRALRFPLSASMGTWYRVDRPARDSARTTVVEFVVPWDSIPRDSAGRYQVGLIAFDRCADTLGPVVLTGSRFPAARPQILTPTILVQLAVIAVLLVVFVVLQFTVLKKTRRRQSPRR